MTNFEPVQIESTCRKENKFDSKIEFDLGRVENIVGKGEITVSPFPTKF